MTDDHDDFGQILPSQTPEEPDRDATVHDLIPVLKNVQTALEAIQKTTFQNRQAVIDQGKIVHSLVDSQNKMAVALTELLDGVGANRQGFQQLWS